MRVWLIESVATFLLGVLVERYDPSYLPWMCLFGALFLTWEGLREIAKKEAVGHIVRNLRQKVGAPMSLILVSVIGIIFANFYWWLIQKATLEEQETLEQAAPEFRVSDNSLAFINLTQSLENTGSGLFWVTYRSSFGDTASPVALAQFMEITNLLPTSETIKSYSVAINTEECGWIDLSPIYIRGARVWFTYEGLEKASLLDFAGNGLDFVLENPIPPHGTITGWWFFDSKTKCNVPKGSMIQYKVSLKTFTGIEFEYVTPRRLVSNDPGEPGKTEGYTRGPQFVVPPGKPQMDISKFHKRLYSDPIK